MEKEKVASPNKQRELLIELSDDEKIVVKIFHEQELVQIDYLYFKSKLSSSPIPAALLMLEMQGIVSSSPGKISKLT